FGSTTAAALLLATPAFAYGTEGATWAGGRATFRVNPNFTDPSTGDAAAQVRAIVAASMAWTLDGAAGFGFDFEGTTDRAEVNLDDGVNSVFYVNQPSSEGALALTFYSYSRSTGRMRGFDVVFFGSSAAGGDFVWSTQTPTPGSNYDVQDTATHELGHALGLAHSTVSGATMSPTAAPGATWARTLEADDRAGIQFLYGPGSPPPPMIDSVEPERGALAGGDVATIRGSAFPSSTPVIVLVGNAECDGVRVRAFDTLTFVVPPGAALGPADVVVRTRGGDAVLPGAFRYEPNPVSLSINGSPRLGSQILLTSSGPPNAPFALLADVAAGTATWHGVGLELAGTPRLTFLHDAIEGRGTPLDGAGVGPVRVDVPRNPRLALRVVHFQAVVRTGTPQNAEGLEATNAILVTLTP
ncbi:MAG: matrixin family metalloprotease, partial [Planctomycetes bacterium]|nr:matrixin family metalloprotease [Planctomycetota bacterium]